MSHDGPTLMLMQHLSDVERRRRVVSLKMKEVETKVAFATDEHAQLERTCASVAECEEQLKGELDALTEEQRQTQLQLVSANDCVRRTQVEEPLLLQHDEEQYRKVKEELCNWRRYPQELEDLHQTWENDDLVAPLRKEIESLDEAIAGCTVDRERLEQEIRDGEMEITRHLQAKRSATDQSGNSSTVASDVPHEPADSTVDGPAIQLIKEAVQRLRFEWLQEEADYQRHCSSLQREVSNLSGRAKELRHWHGEVVKASGAITTTLNHLQRCTERRLCVLHLTQNEPM